MRRHEDGFTLVEVVIALAILGIGLLGMVTVISYTTKMNISAHEQALAIRAAEKKIEQMSACMNFDDIFIQFFQQAEGYGWEQIGEPATDGGMLYLKPLNWALPQNKANLVLPSGYVCPTPDPKATLFVRFNVDPLTPTILAPAVAPIWSAIMEQGSGTFMDARDVFNNPVADQDLNNSGTTTDRFKWWFNPLTSAQTQNGAAAPYVPYAGAMKMIPVWIDIYWQGINGPGHLTYKYTFYRKS